MTRRSRKILAIVSSLVIPGLGQIAIQKRTAIGLVLFTVGVLIWIATAGVPGSLYICAVVHLWSAVDAAIYTRKKKGTGKGSQAKATSKSKKKRH
ncbi:MAG: hypothetical protein D8M59_03220 [Planctomycetes bacterium]|nr:hypothetical protein [Planctomycetota bacterium]